MQHTLGSDLVLAIIGILTLIGLIGSIGALYQLGRQKYHNK